MLYKRGDELDVQALGIIQVGAGKEIVFVVDAEVAIAVYVFVRQGIVYGLCYGKERQ